MIIPSIDIIQAQAVQLIGGKERVLDAGDPLAIARKFSIAGTLAVIDLDAALSQGSNERIIQEIIQKYPSRVGGGIRSYETAKKWLDLGAEQIIIGTKASPDFLSKLPRSRIIAALDSENDEVVIKGWREKTGQNLLGRIEELKNYVSGFLVTFVEREGRMLGLQPDRIVKVVAAAGSARVTIAGGIKDSEDVRTLDMLGADAQVGMALYTGKLDLADAITALISVQAPQSLIPTVVCDEHGRALGLCYSSKESITLAVAEMRGIYQSRTRGIWRKGESSGATQELLKIDLDCDRDCLRFTVRQSGSGFCHKGTCTCWETDKGLPSIETHVSKTIKKSCESSYTTRLMREPDLLSAKLREEAKELSVTDKKEECVRESADLLYFMLCKMKQQGVRLAEVEHELYLRSLKLTRRPGDAKPEFIEHTELS